MAQASSKTKIKEVSRSGKRAIKKAVKRKNLIEIAEESKNLRWFLIVPSLVLTVMGLVMVLSASSVEAVAAGAGSYDLFVKQSLWAVFALICLTVFSITPVSIIKKIAWPSVIIAFILLSLVAFTSLGVEVGGNTNWLDIGGFRIQPSEATKLALILWMGMIYSNKGLLVKNWMHAIIPVLFPIGGGLLALIMAGRDLGTVIIFGLILLTGMIVSGSNWKVISITGSLGAIGAIGSTIFSENRMLRVNAWLGDCSHESDPCFQSVHGLHALASGGLFGVGLGQSRQKWSYVPEAENDFIFSILGEELGFVASVFIIMMFAVMAFALYVGAKRSKDSFSRIVLICIMMWLTGQAFINIAMVTGLLPVIGVPLPFISYGGSALTMCLVGVGIATSIMREQEVNHPFRLTWSKNKKVKVS